MIADDILKLEDGRKLHKFRVSGTGNMATLADENPSPAFGLQEQFSLEYVRGWTTSGTGSALLELMQKLPTDRSGRFDRVIRRYPGFGIDGEDFIQNFIDDRMHPNDRAHFTWRGDTLLVPVWTNPDSGTMEWGLEVGLATMPRRLEQ